jgi:hypothetical protein
MGRQTLLWLAIALTLTSAPALAVPRYSLRYNQSCALCHVNPTGGGQRSLFGAQFFAYTDLAMRTLKPDELDRVNPELSEQVQIGFDGRTVFHVSDVPARDTFFQMQGDLYVNVTLAPEWGFYLDKGLYDDFELAVAGHVLPWSGYVKAGRFHPPYGLQVADHTAFVRDRLGLGYAWKEAGVEVGFHPERVSLAIAVTNGSTGFEDTDTRKAVTGRLDWRGRLGDLRGWLGVSGRWNGAVGEDDRMAGGHAGLAVGPLTLLGEASLRRLRTDALATLAEVGIVILRGITLRVEHDYFDPDVDVASGAESMVVVGAEIVPTGYLQLIGNLRYFDPSRGSRLSEHLEADVQLHFFY